MRDAITRPGLAGFVEDFRDEPGLTSIDLAASDTGGAIGQIIAARQPGRLATLTLTLTLTSCETHDNVPARAFRPAVLLARTGCWPCWGH